MLFLVDRTNGRAYDTMYPSVSLSVICNVCFVAKRTSYEKKLSEAANSIA